MRAAVGLILFVGMLLGALLVTSPVHASSSLKVQPLLYEESLKKGEVKKGFIDVSNPTSATVTVDVSVQAFRQIDNDGTLEFYDSDQIKEGLVSDFDEFTLGPREVMRLYFILDGNKLPSGDVFAALFATGRTEQSGTIAQAVRVGTLFILENGTPGARDAEITSLEASLWQTGATLEGSYRIKNTAKEGQATGFRPDVSISLTPFGGTFDHQGSLVFAGRERTNQFDIPTNAAGLYYLEVTHMDSSQGSWVLLLPMWFQFTLIGLLVGLFVIVKQRHRLFRRHFKRK